MTLGACGDDDTSSSPDQRALNSVIVGSYDELPADDSAVVSAIGVELVALGAPLQAWFEPGSDRDALLQQMTAAVDRIDGRLTPERATEVRTTFEPYVVAWRDLLAALDADDADAYERAIDRLRGLDQIRIERVEDVYGEEVTAELLNRDGDRPARDSLAGRG
jgi:hypothetical protein